MSSALEELSIVLANERKPNPDTESESVVEATEGEKIAVAAIGGAITAQRTKKNISKEQADDLLTGVKKLLKV